jgi:hypothetical protein
MNSSKRGCSDEQFVHYQVGAPALIYYQKNHDSLDVPIAKGKPSTIQSTHHRLNRTKFLWNVPFYHGLKQKQDEAQEKRQSETDYQPNQIQAKNPPKQRKKSKRAAKPKLFHQNEASEEFDNLFDVQSDYRKKRENSSLSTKRRAMLLKLGNEYNNEEDGDDRILHRRKRKSVFSPGSNFDVFDDCTTFDYPYIPAVFGKGKARNLKLSEGRCIETRKFSMDRQLSDPAYLAPFGIDVLNTLEVKTESSIDNTMLSDKSTGNQNQGNCLVVVPCPCPPCSQKSASQRSWCLFHPKGPAMDRLCISNMIPPNGHENAGHMFRKENLKKYKNFRAMTRHALTSFPNEIHLGDNILEVKQSGTWNYMNRKCIFVVRTATFVSVLQVTVMKYYDAKGDNYDFAEDVCWGNYAIEEKHRIDLRSLSLSASFRSFLPTSLACHPEYGNDCNGPKFAFSACSTQGELNAIYHCLPEAGYDLHLTKHKVPSLKHVSLIDFTSSQPMCLWSAASSYVRPALSRDLLCRQPILGMGSSLYTVDLRDNDATFQWSPSAEEMVTEGVHSISCITTDWQRDTTVFVSSNSAGKTWEIDARMPCRSVNVWSLSYSSEDSSLANAQKGFYRGGLSMITKTVQIDSATGLGATTSPYLTADTTPGSYGFHVLQQPLTRPIFHAEPVECIATPGLHFSNTTSIATSSVFVLPEVANDMYPCGIAAFRVPFTQFGERNLADFANDTSDLLCSLTLTNKGDLYCYSLLESKHGIGVSQDSVDLPIGVKTLSIPKEMDGRMKDLDHKHWKPTGGMNLKLYLTNQFPASRNVLCAEETCQPSSLLIYKSAKKMFAKKHTKKVTRRAEKAIPIDQNDVCEFKQDKSDITLSTESRLAGNESVLVPPAMSEKANKEIKFHEAGQTDESEEAQQQNSDLSNGLIKIASDLWNDMNSDPEEDHIL